MKKRIGLICLALVLALGSLGVAYAGWTDTVTISGPVTTGEVCLEFVDVLGEGYAIEGRVSPLSDMNYTSWVPRIGFPAMSCPPGYRFDDIHTEEKDVGYLDLTSILASDPDGNGCPELLEMTIRDAYPYFVTEIRVHIENCGTIPVKFRLPVINQHPSLRIWYLDSVGTQLHPDEWVEISFYVGVAQYLWDPEFEEDSDVLTPQDTPLGFTIAIEAIQWNEY